MDNYIEVRIAKAVLYITPQEINRLLMNDLQLYKEVLQRSKGIVRVKQKERQCAAKFSQNESLTLNNLMQ